MRMKIAIPVIVVFIGLLVALLLSRPSAPPVSLTFVGRVGWERYADGTRAARFILTNNTARWIDTTTLDARIQVKTTSGWADYVGTPIKLAWIQVKPHGYCPIDRHVP